MLASNMHLLPFLLLAPCYMKSLANATEQSVLRSLDTAPVIHFAITRRDGAFTGTVVGEDWVDLEYLVKQVEIAECRFNLTKRVVKGNKLVRKAGTDGAGGKDGMGLMGDIASRGAWYVNSPITIKQTFHLIGRCLGPGTQRSILESLHRKSKWTSVCCPRIFMSSRPQARTAIAMMSSSHLVSVRFSIPILRLC